MKLKHSKYRNTGILFELLTRQLTSETISGTKTKAIFIMLFIDNIISYKY